MIPYNTELEKLTLPEYGRLIHEMVKICATIEEREKRNEFAASIVETMKSMTQEKGKQPDDRKYWDHLFVISGHSLDVDSPFERPEEGEKERKPDKIPYSNSDFGRRHYGNVLQRLVREVSLMANSEEKDACVELLSNHIKKLLVVSNSENANNQQVFADLAAMSNGNIALEEGIFDLPEYKEEKPAKTNKKKKNRQ